VHPHLRLLKSSTSTSTTLPLLLHLLSQLKQQQPYITGPTLNENSNPHYTNTNKIERENREKRERPSPCTLCLDSPELEDKKQRQKEKNRKGIVQLFFFFLVFFFKTFKNTACYLYLIISSPCINSLFVVFRHNKSLHNQLFVSSLQWRGTCLTWRVSASASFFFFWVAMMPLL
jgi:hypothetical protein